MKFVSATLGFAAMVVVSTGLLALLGSGLNIHVATAAVVCAAIVALAAWVTTAPHALPKAHFWDWLMLIVFALVSLRAFLWLVYTRGDEICVLSPNNLGDLSLHLNLIRYLASGIAFWPESSILSNVPMTYPLGSDLFNSVLEVLGIDTYIGLVWTGLVGAALTGYALWLWGGAFGLAAFLFNGGLTGFAILRTFEIEDFQSEMVWKNLFLSMFVTQRGLLMALPSGLILLYAWRERYFRGSAHVLPVWLQLLIYASLPLFNLHAFLFLSLVLAAIFTAKLAAVRSWNPLAAGAPRELFVFVALALVPATLGILLVTGFLSMAGAIRWAPGWVGGGNLSTWIWNFGLTLPLTLLLVFVLFRSKDNEARCFVWTAVGIFGLCGLVSFAPWEWDNIKVIVWAYFLILPFLWTELVGQWPLALRAVVCVALFWSGFITLFGGLAADRHGFGIANRAELDAIGMVVKRLPAEARYAGWPTWGHPILLQGRKMVLGYPGHLWTQGFKFDDTNNKLQALMTGAPNWKAIARELHTRYLFWGREEKTNYAASKKPWEREATLVSSGEWGAIYDLETAPKQPGQAPTPAPALPGR